MVFSVLIPVYNVERYLAQCLNSVLAQDFSDFEVILVNDGSTDSSASICLDFTQRDSRIKYFENENKGLLQTRRFSIKKASGDYLLFLDSDDFWEQGILSALYAEISKREIDLICYRFRTVNDVGKRIREDTGLFPDRMLFSAENKELFVKEFVSSSRLNTMWTKCVKKSIVDADADYSVFKDKKGEDVLQSIPLIRNAKSILYMDDVYVNYRLSTSGRGRNFKTQYLDDYEEVRCILRDNLMEMNSSDELLDCFFAGYIDGMMSFMDSIVSISKNAQSFEGTCYHFRRFSLWKEAANRVDPTEIGNMKHRIDYILLKENRYRFLYQFHKVKNYFKRILMIL